MKVNNKSHMKEKVKNLNHHTRRKDLLLEKVIRTALIIALYINVTYNNYIMPTMRYTKKFLIYVVVYSSILFTT